MDNVKKKTVKHIPVFYACDSKYAPIAAVSMASLLFNTNSFIEFYILDCDMGEKNRRKMEMLKEKFSNFSIEFIKVDSNGKFGYIELRNYLTTACFARLLIPDLKPDMGKIVYLDCDTIVMGDIADMYAQELNGYAIGAVPDPNVFDDPLKKHNQYKAALLSDRHLYFNSGVMLMDCDVWRKNDMLPKLIAAERMTAATRYFNDQDVLNKAFDCNYQTLDVRFNVKSNLITHCPQENIVVRHYTGHMKPWLKVGFLQINAHDFWFYCQMTPFFAEMLVNGLTELAPIHELKL